MIIYRPLPFLFTCHKLIYGGSKLDYPYPFRSAFSYRIFKNKYSHENCEEWEDLCYTLAEEVCDGKLAGRPLMNATEREQLYIYMKDMKFIPGGRYLYYAGRNFRAYNNCYCLSAIEDTREDWADLAWKQERCLMTGGGTGAVYSVYRPRGSSLSRTGGEASGPLPAMKISNEIGRNVRQGGSRRSALWAGLHHWHGDIDEFLHAKDWYNMPVNGTGLTIGHLKENDFNFPAPLDTTNISVIYDTSWLEGYKRTGRIGDVFAENVRQALRTSEPGFSFDFYEHNNENLRNACVVYDTPILTRDGYKKIGDTVGDDVEIWNGKNWSHVVPFSTGKKDIWEVQLSDGASIRCSPDHRFLTVKGFKNNRATRVEAKNLRPGIRLQKWDMPIIYNGIEYPIDGYSQGFYSGDGNLGYKYSWIYGEKIRCKDRLIGKIGNYYEDRDAWTWNHGDMLDKRFVPIDGSLSYCLEWLSGLLDADGTVTRDKNGNGFQITSIDHDFLRRTRLMLSRMGVRAKVVSGNPARVEQMTNQRGETGLYECKETMRLLIGNEDTYLLMRMGLNLTRLNAHSLPPQRDARRYVKVVSCRPTGEQQEVFCVNEPELHQVTFNGIVTGNCTEVTSADDSDVCNLGSVNFSRIESEEELIDVVKLATKFLVCGTLIADLPYKEVYNVREKNRRLGLGIMGMHEWLLKSGYKYEVTEELHRWLGLYQYWSEVTAKKFTDELCISNPVASQAIAPTGTLAILAGTTSGIEPLYAIAYKRRYLTSGDVWKYQYVIDGIAKYLINDCSINPDRIESASDLSKDYERRIKFQYDVQKYVSMGISSTINMPAWGSEDNNEDTVDKFAYTLASYAHGLRGFTCYADGSRGGQPITPVDYDYALKHEGTEFIEEYNDVCELGGKGGSCGI